MASNPTVRTWLDPFDWWHVTVICPTADASGARNAAREAIANEIRERANGTATEEFLSSDRFQLDYVVRGEKTPEGIRYEFAEYAPDRSAPIAERRR